MSQGTINGLVFGGSVTLDPHSVTLDAGGIVRTGTQTTLFDGKTLNTDDTNLWENAGTAGTYTNSKYDMAVTSGQWIIKQSKIRTPYFSGKSQRIEVTMDGFGADANVVKRVGYFSSNAVSPFDSAYDGFWLENDGTTITLNAARSGTMTLDALDITGWTGYDNLGEYQTIATWDNFTVCEFKFLWLGGAVLVLSIKTSAGFVEAHRFDYAGTATDVFISSPNQPVRYEIRSSTGTGNLRYICCQVASEGSIDESGKTLAVFNTTAIATNAVGTMYALIGLKKSTTHRDIGVQIVEISTSTTSPTNDTGILFLVVNPTLSAALTYGNVSRVQVAYATNQTITAGSGRVIAAIPAASSSGGSGALAKNFLAWLSSTLANAHDEYVLCYMPTTATQDNFGILTLKEY